MPRESAPPSVRPFESSARPSERARSEDGPAENAREKSLEGVLIWTCSSSPITVSHVADWVESRTRRDGEGRIQRSGASTLVGRLRVE